jgi:hypothetical protein
MSGTVTLARASFYQMAGSIAIPIAATIGVILLAHRIFDVVPAASAPASAGGQRPMASTTGNHLASNHTSLAHRTSLFTHADHGGLELSAKAPQLITTAIDRAIATHRSGPKPVGDIAHPLTRRCC